MYGGCWRSKAKCVVIKENNSFHSACLDRLLDVVTGFTSVASLFTYEYDALVVDCVYLERKKEKKNGWNGSRETKERKERKKKGKKNAV